MVIKPKEYKQKDGYISFKISITDKKKRTQRLANYGKGLKCLATDKEKLKKCRQLVQMEVDELVRETFINHGKLNTHQLLKTNENIEYYIDWFMSSKKPTTKRNYINLLSLLNKFNQPITIKEINIEWLRAFIAFMEKRNMANNSINMYVTRVIAVLNHAIHEQIIDSFPFKAIPKLKIIQKDIVQQVLTKEELETIKNLKTGYKNGRNPQQNGLSENASRTRDAFLFASYVQGLRVSDVINLKPTDIQLGINSPVLVKVHQKTGKLIKQEIPKPAHDIIKPYLLEGRTTNIFGLSDRKNLAKHMKMITRLAGINKNITFHSARKTFINLCFEAGMDITEVSKLCGDTMPILEKHYIAWTDNRNRAAAQKWDKFLSSTN